MYSGAPVEGLLPRRMARRTRSPEPEPGSYASRRAAAADDATACSSSSAAASCSQQLRMGSTCRLGQTGRVATQQRMRCLHRSSFSRKSCMAASDPPQRPVSDASSCARQHAGASPRIDCWNARRAGAHEKRSMTKHSKRIAAVLTREWQLCAPACEQLPTSGAAPPRGCPAGAAPTRSRPPQRCRRSVPAQTHAG
jgi:hypothetical protein